MPIDNGGSPSIAVPDTNHMRTQVGPKKPQKSKAAKANEKSNENNQETSKNDMEVENTPTSAKSLYLTRANVTVRLPKNIETLSANQTMVRIITIIKKADAKARIIAQDNDGNETEFDEKQTSALVENEANQQNSEKYFQAMVITKRSEATGVISIRSEISLKAVMKHPLVRQGLNEEPKIYIRPNYLDCWYPTMVGFFTNVSPRADYPEVFERRMEALTQYDDGRQFPKYQLEHGMIHAKNMRCTVIKILAGTQEDKEAIRKYFKENEDYLQGDEFIPETEFYSAPIETRMKIIDRQAKYGNGNRTVFIKGFRDIYCNLEPKEKETPMDVSE